MKKDILEALKFYEIDDIDYINKCIKCLDDINNNIEILNKFNCYHKILFVDETNQIRNLWKYKDINELFSNNTNPFITNVLLLSGYKYHMINMKKYNFDLEQINIHKKRVKETLTNDIYKRKYLGIRISQMLWGTYFINCRLIEIGILQFEYFDNKTIKIHITSDYKLDNNLVKKSIMDSKKYISKYFNIFDYDYYCESWLLSTNIHNVLDEKSNIYNFYNLFEVKDGDSCIEDVLNFVYKIKSINNYNDLKEETSLQKKIKNILLTKKDIKKGIGKLKKII